MSNSCIWPIGRALSGVTTPYQSGPGSNGNEGVLCIPQGSSITGPSPSDCLVSYQDIHWEGGSYHLCIDPVGVFYSHSRLGLSAYIKLAVTWFVFLGTVSLTILNFCYLSNKDFVPFSAPLYFLTLYFFVTIIYFRFFYVYIWRVFVFT